ncbi:ATP-dependent DNA helicase [Chryseolinea sp. H1M3-3]|uniref:ATP-dependent DNA helicase n=1 Tax=Chryseolinea sp. H1M3-3 TaxID=3034144 RepID=UPI0023EC48C4|nr:ATP-dependent DNA helicase [Chryseolinea sp. H1M3-3]
MASNNSIHKKWIENFNKCPLVDKASSTFKNKFARQLFYGRTEEDYPKQYPAGFQTFYNGHYEIDRSISIETALRYLHFIGVRLRKEAVISHFDLAPGDFHVFMQKCFFLLRTLAHHRDSLSLNNPFSENIGDIYFFIRIENGQKQLAIFDSEVRDISKRDFKIPDGYEDDPVVKKLFDTIENSSRSFFISGKAGTGKSTFIHFFTQKTKKEVILTAFTGIAAMNIGGVTLHSFFKFPTRALLPGDEDIKVFLENDPKRKIIEDLDIIIIDEVSMLRADLLQAIDYSLRNNGGDPEKLFGGKQIIFVGDIFQLPPVTKDSDDVDRFLFNELYNSPYFFDCDAYKQLDPIFFEFTKSQRQREDLEFVELLDKVRNCDVDDGILRKLNERYDPNYIPKKNDYVITLTTNNSIANTENAKRLGEISLMLYTFKGDVKGDFDEEKLSVNGTLYLKKGAQVIFIKNDLSGDRRWVNGTIGKVEFVADDIIEVKLPDGSVHSIEKETWDYRGYKYDRGKGRITSEAKGTFTQYPIKLAWAITIHKSQGLTFSNVVIDLGSGAFINGQLYTALSRCKKLSGIILKRKIKKDDIIQDIRLIEFYKTCQNILHI